MYKVSMYDGLKNTPEFEENFGDEDDAKRKFRELRDQYSGSGNDLYLAETDGRNFDTIKHKRL